MSDSKRADPTTGRGRSKQLQRKREAAVAASEALSGDDVAEIFDMVTANVAHDLGPGVMDVYLADVLDAWVSHLRPPRRFVDATAHATAVADAVASLRVLLEAIASTLPLDAITQLVTMTPMTMTMGGFLGQPHRYLISPKDFLRVTRAVVRRAREFSAAPQRTAAPAQVQALVTAASVAEVQLQDTSNTLRVLNVQAARRRKAVVAQRRAEKEGLVAGKVGGLSAGTGGCTNDDECSSRSISGSSATFASDGSKGEEDEDDDWGPERFSE